MIYCEVNNDNDFITVRVKTKFVTKHTKGSKRTRHKNSVSKPTKKYKLKNKNLYNRQD